MAATNPTVLHVTCSVCRAEYDFPATMAGRSGPCAKCGADLAIPSAAAIRAGGPAIQPKIGRQGSSQPKHIASQPPKPTAPLQEAQWSAIECRVCGTRLTGPISHVGQAIKCPDCGAKSILPPPPKPKKKNIPAAMEGEQYELWEVDEAPLPSELIKREPKYIAISCRMCQTLMQATERQVGQTIACPDCGTKHVVPPLEAKPTRQVLSRDEELFLLEPAPVPVQTPQVLVPPRRKMLYEVEEEAERARREEVAKKGKKVRGAERDDRGRPIMPRQPLMTGVISFLFSPGVPVRWGVLAGTLTFVGWVGLKGVSIAMSGGFGAIAGMCFFALGLIAAVLWSTAAASIFLAIVVESSEGNDRVFNWPPPNFFEWLPELGYMIVAVLVSAFPGWAIGSLASGDDWLAPALFFGSTLVCLPIVLLSQLDISSPFGIVSGRVLASFGRCPISWMLLYIQAAIVAAIVAGNIYVASQTSGEILFLLPVVIVGGLILYARLIGRLGWKLAETMAVIEPDDRE